MSIKKQTERGEVGLTVEELYAVMRAEGKVANEEEFQELLESAVAYGLVEVREAAAQECAS